MRSSRRANLKYRENSWPFLKVQISTLQSFPLAQPPPGLPTNRTNATNNPTIASSPFVTFVRFVGKIGFSRDMSSNLSSLPFIGWRGGLGGGGGFASNRCRQSGQKAQGRPGKGRPAPSGHRHNPQARMGALRGKVAPDSPFITFSHLTTSHPMLCCSRSSDLSGRVPMAHPIRKPVGQSTIGDGGCFDMARLPGGRFIPMPVFPDAFPIIRSLPPFPKFGHLAENYGDLRQTEPKIFFRIGVEGRASRHSGSQAIYRLEPPPRCWVGLTFQIIFVQVGEQAGHGWLSSEPDRGPTCWRPGCRPRKR